MHASDVSSLRCAAQADGAVGVSGFRVLTLGQDLVLLIRALTASLEKVRPVPSPSTSMLPKL